MSLDSNFGTLNPGILAEALEEFSCIVCLEVITLHLKPVYCKPNYVKFHVTRKKYHL